MFIRRELLLMPCSLTNVGDIDGSGAKAQLVAGAINCLGRKFEIRGNSASVERMCWCLCMFGTYAPPSTNPYALT